MDKNFPIGSSSIFGEVGAYFFIPPILKKAIREELTKALSDTSFFEKKYANDYRLSFDDSSNHTTIDLEIAGPRIAKKYKIVQYFFYMPYLIIKNDPTRYEKYLNFHERGVKELFTKYKIILNKSLPDVYTAIRKCAAAIPSEKWNESNY